MTYDDFLNWYTVLYNYIDNASTLEFVFIFWAFVCFYSYTYETIVEIIEFVKKIIIKIGGKNK